MPIEIEPAKNRANGETLSAAVRDSRDHAATHLPITALLALQFFVSAGIAVALLIDKPGWYGAATGLGGAHASRAANPRTLDSALDVRRLGFWYELHRRKRQVQNFEPFDTELPDGSRIGFRWDGKLLMSLLRIVEDPQAITIMEPAIAVSGQTVSLDAGRLLAAVRRHGGFH